ncbi:MAG TPA: helical backbone metal receptor [Steroidobacteraceae bacterium]|nr:helical backbone metal receptor [Steroidobacteraceae bacterium]
MATPADAGGRARRLGRALTWLLLLTGGGGAAYGAVSALSIEHPWSRATPPGVTVAAGYLEVRNLGGPDLLTGASSPLAERVEFHESRVEGGIARMRPVDSLPVAAGARLVFAPGGLHLMLLGLRAPLTAGLRVPLVLSFATAGAVATELVVDGSAAPAEAPAAGPRRIVTLTPHLTELVYAAGAGDRLVGTVDTSDYPPAARAVPRIGDVTHIDAERLLALRPDLVLIWGDGSPAEQHALLKRLALPVLSLEQHSLADVPATLERLGRVLGTEPVATAAAARLRAQIAGLAARYQNAPRLKVFYQVWGTPLFTLGGRHVATEMLRICGAENIFADQARSSFMVDEESVYARDPDVIALAGTEAESAEWLTRWRGRAPLRAVATGAVIALDPDLTNRMGPRIGAGTEALCEKLADIRRRVPPSVRR